MFSNIFFGIKYSVFKHFLSINFDVWKHFIIFAAENNM